MAMTAAGLAKTTGPFPFDDVDTLDGQTYSVTGYSATSGRFDRELKTTTLSIGTEAEYQALGVKNPNTLYLRKLPEFVAVPAAPTVFDRTDFTGMAGYAFTLAQDTVVNTLGRAVSTVFTQSHTVGIWREPDETLMTSVVVSPASTVVNGYATERVKEVTLAAGTYRIAVSEVSGQDSWTNASAITTAAGITVTSLAFATGATIRYPLSIGGGAGVAFAHPNFYSDNALTASLGEDESNILPTTKWRADETPAPIEDDIRQRNGYDYRLNDAVTKGSAVDPATDPSVGFGTILDDWVCIDPENLYEFISASKTYTIDELPPAILRVSVDSRDGNVDVIFPAGAPLEYIFDVQVRGYGKDFVTTLEVAGERMTDENRQEAADSKFEFVNVAGEAAWKKISLVPPVWQQFKSHPYDADAGFPALYETTMAIDTAGVHSGIIFTADSSTVDIEYGDGATETVASGATFTHNYAGVPASPLKFIFTEWQRPTRIQYTAGPWAGTMDEMISLSRYNSINWMELKGATTFTGDITQTPEGVTYFNLAGSNTTFGSIGNLPASLTYYSNLGLNTTSGQIGALPVGLTNYSNTGNNITSGSTDDLPVSLTSYSNSGANTTSGDVDKLPAGLIAFVNQGNNTTSGDIGLLPAGCNYYLTSGANTTFGNVDALPVSMTYYNNTGNNTTSGDVGSLPITLTHYNNIGTNTTFGSIDTLPAGLTTFSNGGLNVTTGDIANLPATLTTYINIGNNTVGGSIGSLKVGLVYFDSRGNNVTSGDIVNLPNTVNYYRNEGANTAVCTSVPTFNSTFEQFYQRGVGMLPSHLDNILEGLATSVTTWAGSKIVDLRVASLIKPTNVSTDPGGWIDIIQGNGATVLVNV